MMVRCFGKNRVVVHLEARDFRDLRRLFSEHGGPVRVGNLIQRTRTVFKWAHESGLIDRPMRFGPEFRRPPKAVFRRLRAERGPKLFSAAECRALLDAAKQPLRAMILLGLNCGFGNSDCATLPTRAVDLKWIDYPRPKTGIPRRCPLWRETAEALREVMQRRPQSPLVVSFRQACIRRSPATPGQAVPEISTPPALCRQAEPSAAGPRPLPLAVPPVSSARSN